jgi:hypothetical protein
MTVLMGHVVAGFAAQGMLALGVSVFHLFVGTLGTLGISFLMSIPFVFSERKRLGKASMKNLDSEAEQVPLPESEGVSMNDKIPFWKRYILMFKSCYGRPETICWSVFYGFLFCQLLSTESYGSSLWDEVAENSKMGETSKVKDINGIMDALGRLAGAVGAFLVGCIPHRCYAQHMRYLLLVVALSTLVFAASNWGMVHDMSNIYLSASAWCIALGAGFSVCSMIKGILAIQVDHKTHLSFIYALQGLLSISLQTLIQLILSNLHVTITQRYVITAIVSAVTVLFVPPIWYLLHRAKKTA